MWRFIVSSRSKLFLLFAVNALAACGGESAYESIDITGVPPGEMCPTGGALVSVGDEEQLLCNGVDGEDGKDGKDGATGATGKTGATGPVGAAGAGWTPQTITGCVASARLPYSGVVADLYYSLVTFNDGSVFVSCEAVTNGAVGASGSRIYAGWQNGAVGGACSVTSDASGAATRGWWSFEVVAGAPTATYHDVGTADDLAKYTFVKADCPTATR